MSFVTRSVSLFVLLICCESCNRTNDKQAIEDTWNEYCISIVAKDSKTAVSLVDQATIAYYDWFADRIRFDDSAKIKNRYLTEELMLLLMRTTVSCDTLISLGGKELMERCVKDDWFGGDLSKNKLTNIVVKGKTAMALMTSDTNKNIQSPIQFAKEDGKWKIAFAQFYANFYPKIESYMQDELKKRGETENKFTAETIMFATGREMPESAWFPLLVSPR